MILRIYSFWSFPCRLFYWHARWGSLCKWFRSLFLRSCDVCRALLIPFVRWFVEALEQSASWLFPQTQSRRGLRVSLDLEHHVYFHTYLLPSDAATNESDRQQRGGKAARKQTEEPIQECAAMWVNRNYSGNCCGNVYSDLSTSFVHGWTMK